MVIAIDGYEANVPNRVGSGRYAFEILKHLCALLKPQKSVSIQVYLPQAPLPDMPAESLNWRYVIAGPKRLWTFIGLPLALSIHKRPDVVFSPTHYAPRFVTIPRVISIMDLSYLEYPQMFRAKDLHQLVNWTKYSVFSAARILTISQFTKNAIMRVYGVPASRIVVTYPGMSKIVDRKSKSQTAKNYILSVGTLQPRKNYVRLIEAFAHVTKALKAEYPDITLVIVGKKGWLYEEILAAPSKFGVSEHVKFLDFVPDSDLPALYKNALCFVLPSLYEGFGLPVLEAMAYGVPVVVSDVSSLPEIAGSAGIYVQPDKVDSIAQGLNRAISERGSAAGQNRIALGLTQVKKFTWEAAARKTLKVLTEVGGGKS